MKKVARKYYVEFVGAHGAGKTHIYHAITKQHMLAPHKVVYPAQVKRRRSHFFVRVPLLALKNMRHLMFVLWFFLRYAKVRWVNYRNVARPLLKMVLLHPYFERFDHDLLLKDDMLHLVPRIMFKEGVDIKVALHKYFRHFAHLYDGLVYVDIPIEVMRERFKNRFPGRTERFKASRKVIHERAHQQNKILKRVLEEQTQVPLLVLNGSDDVQENARRVVAFIQTRVFKGLA